MGRPLMSFEPKIMPRIAVASEPVQLISRNSHVTLQDAVVLLVRMLQILPHINQAVAPGWYPPQLADAGNGDRCAHTAPRFFQRPARRRPAHRRSAHAPPGSRRSAVPRPR